MTNWEKYYSRNGCPYYLNYKTMKSQWEHPYFAKVLADAADYNDVIYAAYRTALKLLHIRNNHHLQSLDVDKISCAFSEILSLHGIRVDEYMTLTQLEEAITRLYLYCDTSLSQSVWTGSVSSCLLFFFDGKKRGTVNTLSVLVFLTTLCADKLTNKYSFLFQCLNQHELVGAQDISHLKKIVFTILTRLQEDRAYKNAYEGNGTTMTKDMFLKWLLTEPKFIVWLSTMHRVHAAVSVRHATVKCYRCKNYPIIGLRYRCLQCFNVDMCFQCFIRIPAYGKHDKSHAIEEYCMQSNKMQDVKAFLTKLRNNVKKKSRHPKSVESEFDLTARRQPATVWHDPKLSDAADLRSCANTDVCTDILNALGTYTPINSPAVDRISRNSPKSSVFDDHHSLTRGHKNRIDSNQIEPNRYSQSLPRKSKLRCTVQSPDRGNKISALPDRNSSNERYQSSDRGQLKYTAPCRTSHTADSESYEKSNSYHRAEPTPYTSRHQYDRNKDVYNSYGHTNSSHNDTLDLDFYSSSTRHAVPYTPASYSYPVNYQYSCHKPVGGSGTRPTPHNNLSSEDEGIVVNSESDSSVSHFATFDNRKLYTVPGQATQSAYNDTYSRKYNSAVTQGSEVKRSKEPFEYTKYSWDKKCDTTNFSSTPYADETSGTLNRYDYHKAMDNSRPALDNSSIHKERLVKAVEGVQAAICPIIRAYQV